MYKKILVPLDGSEWEKKALDHAEELAKTYGAEIILFQVVSFMPIYGTPEFVMVPVTDEKRKGAAEMYLTNLAEEIKTRGHKVKVIVRTGQKVAVEIIDFAKGNGSDTKRKTPRGVPDWRFQRTTSTYGGNCRRR